MFRIGEFSQLAQVSIRMLRHYDQIGLLRPAHVDAATGYRHYTSGQLADVHRIIALKDLGLTLNQVQRLVGERLSTQDIAAMLRLEHARAEQARTAAERRLAELGRKLAEIDDRGTMSTVDVMEKAVPAMSLWAYRTTVTDLAEMQQLVALALAAGAELAGHPPLVVVGHDPFYDTESVDLELGFPVDGPLDVKLGAHRRLSHTTLPAVARMITVVQNAGPTDGHHRAYQAIAAWLETHRCHIAGPGREIVRAAESPDKPVTVEIQYPVEASSGNH